MSSIDDFLADLERMRRTLRSYEGVQVQRESAKGKFRDCANKWFSLRKVLAEEIQSHSVFKDVDEAAQRLLEASYRNTTVRTYKGILRDVREGIVGLQVAAAGGPLNNASDTGLAGDAREVLRRLDRMSPAIGDSYRQVVDDLGDSGRKSFRGTANDLREILREVLDILAPDDLVQAASWYNPLNEARKPKIRPTKADKTRFALETRKQGKTVVRQTITTIDRIEDLLGAVVRSTYDRASAAAHVSMARIEVRSQLRYLNAIMMDLLEG